MSEITLDDIAKQKALDRLASYCDGEMRRDIQDHYKMTGMYHDDVCLLVKLQAKHAEEVERLTEKVRQEKQAADVAIRLGAKLEDANTKLAAREELHREEVERLRAQLDTMSTAQDVYESSLRLIERAYGDENATVQQICERLEEVGRLQRELDAAQATAIDPVKHHLLAAERDKLRNVVRELLPEATRLLDLPCGYAGRLAAKLMRCESDDETREQKEIQQWFDDKRELLARIDAETKRLCGE